ncbi:hypothetical protein [Actinophytocola sp. NPDC049390]|uniref:hypothetical protein n=1 Tax=Actinophytocola sp. NPDC049390 TaxID=3363894 RepID=UPI00379F4E87
MTFPTVPRNVTVELQIDGVWVDVTTSVRQTSPITIKRGASGEGAKIQPGQLRFTIDDGPDGGDGDFNPLNPLGPYFGLIGRNQPVRVTVDGNVRCVMEAARLEPVWDLTHSIWTIPVDAAGVLRRLEQSVAPLKSPLRRYLSGPSVDTPIAYWPMEEGKDAVAYTSVVGTDVAPLVQLQGETDSAAYADLASSEPIPTITNAGILRTRIPAHTSTGHYKIAVFVDVPDPIAADNGTPIYVEGVGGSVGSWLIQQDINGTLQLFALSEAGGGTLLFDSGQIGFNTAGRRFYLVLELDQNGADVDWAMTTYDVDTGAAGFISGTATGLTVGTLDMLQIGIVNQGLDGCSVGHLAVWHTNVSMNVQITDALQAFTGEAASTRIQRIADEEALPVTVEGIDPHLWTARMGPQGLSPALDLVKECAEVDGGTLYEARDSLTLVYKPRYLSYSQDPTVTLDYAAGHVAPPLAPVADDKNTVNDVTAKRVDGGEARVTQTSGPLNVNDPATDPNGVGLYQKAVTVNVEADGHLTDVAGWLVHLGTNDAYRFPSVTVDLAALGQLGATLVAADVLAADVDDRIVITGMTAARIYDDTSLLARGYTEKLDTAYQHTITFACAPEEPWHIAVLDDGIARLDSDSSTLDVAFVAGTDTAMTVTTTGPRWTVDPAEFPLEIRAAGVVLEVTAIAGSSAAFGITQTFTITAAPVNGVVKTIPAGTPIVLADPVYLAR